MATRKIYYNEEEKSFAELQAYRNNKGDLFVDLQCPDSPHEFMFTLIPCADAKELIMELIEQFDMLDPEHYMEGRKMLK